MNKLFEFDFIVDEMVWGVDFEWFNEMVWGRHELMVR